MLEPYERIAGVPFLDETHRAAVEAAAEDLSQRPLRASQAAISGGKLSQVHSGSNAAQRAAQPPLPEVDITPDGIQVPVSLAWQGAAWDLDRIYAATTRALAAAGSLPLASNEPWVESDEAYRERLKRAYPDAELADYKGHMLDNVGNIDFSLPRARLVPMQKGEG